MIDIIVGACRSQFEYSVGGQSTYPWMLDTEKDDVELSVFEKQGYPLLQ